MVDNDQGTETVVDDQQTLPLEQPTDKVVEPTEAEQKIADMTDSEIASQTFSDVGAEEPEKKTDDPKPAAEEPGEEDDPSKILVPKEPEEVAKKDEKPEPKKGSQEWYDQRLADKDAHIKNLEEDNYGYRQQRREAKLDQSKIEHAQRLAQLDDFESLSDQEEIELIQEDPEKYKVYVKQLAEYEKLKGEVGKENGRFTPEEHKTFQTEEYGDFLKQAFQFDYAAESKKDQAAADKRYEELNAMPEVVSMAEALTGYQPGRSGLYTAKQMLLLYQGVTKDQAVTTATIDARKNLTNEIKTTQERVTFDGLPKAESAQVPKDVEALSPTEIANMGPAELKVATEAIEKANKAQDTKAKGIKTKGR